MADDADEFHNALIGQDAPADAVEPVPSGSQIAGRRVTTGSWDVFVGHDAGEWTETQ